MKNVSSAELLKLFTEKAENMPEFKAAISLARQNSQGNIWLVGGFVIRSLIQQLYGYPQELTDFDFILENLHTSIILPEGWEEKKNRHGNPRLVSDKFSIDLVPLQKVNWIVNNHLEPTIENFIAGIPLTAQVLLYDVTNNRLIGKPGVESLLTQTVGVHNAAEVRSLAAHKQITPEEFMEKVAVSLRFNVDFSGFK